MTRRGRTIEQTDAIETMIRDGAPHTEIASTLHVSRTWLRANYPGTAWSHHECGRFGQSCAGVRLLL